MRILLYTLLIIIISLKAYSFDDDCIKSDNFLFVFYDNDKQEFIIIRNEKEVGWHNVEFQRLAMVLKLFLTLTLRLDISYS